jgi:hypothetical protein
MAISVASLISRALSISDHTNSSFLTQGDKHEAINESYRDAYNFLCNNNDDYFLTELEFSITSKYQLPNDFLRLRALDYDDGGKWSEVKKFAINQRNALQQSGDVAPMYRLSGEYLYIIPQDVAYSMRMWYYPQPSVLVSSGISSWVTATAYKIGDMVSQSGSVYVCIIEHTSGTFSTDLAAGKWSLYTDDPVDEIDYPNNLVHEIIVYSAAKNYRAKARQEYAAINERLAELWMRFETQSRRDDANAEKINSVYPKRRIII